MAYNAASLDSFICYYLYIGFAKLYLYLDDPADATVEVARRYPVDRVCIRVRDDSLKQEWKAAPSWPRLSLYSHREVQARQMLNCEHAIACCRKSGEQWLLHVDSDELLFLPDALKEAQRGTTTCPPGEALQRHLAHLDSLSAILFTYRNLEAVPEALECPDMYREVTLFKQHPSRLDESKPSIAAATKYWREAREAGGELFRFYANGKSIVRVCDAIHEVGSVHEWVLPSKAAAASAAFTNNGQLKLSQYVYHQVMPYQEAGGAVLLHFAVCSFETFWRKKWDALGYASPNHRFRGGGGGLDQRANALAIGKRRAEAEAFYRHSMMVCDEGEKRRQLAAGVCVRVHVCNIVSAARQHVLPASDGGLVTPSSLATPAAATPTSTSAAPACPSWLSVASGCSVAAAAAKARSGALAAISGDEVFELMVAQTHDEAQVVAHSMAAEALRATPTEHTARLFARERGLPFLPPPQSATSSSDVDDIDGDGGERYAQFFAALLPRAMRATMHLLPTDHLMFDLVGYWVHPHAKDMISKSQVATLLRTGVVLLPAAFPQAMVQQAVVEAAELVSRDASAGIGLAHASTSRTHERNAWLRCNESPARAPDPPEAPSLPPPVEFFGPLHDIRSSTHPAISGCMRGLRAVAAALENISDLRIAVPRAAVLREIGCGGSRADGPINSGWPDTGCEVACTLVLEQGGGGAADPPRAVSVTSTHGEHSTVRPTSCAILLTLSRQARCEVASAKSSDGALPLWLTLHMWSSTLRSAADGRMLGMTKESREEAARKIEQQRRDGTLTEEMARMVR